MKQLLAWTGSAESTITSEAVMAMAEKFNTGQEVCLPGHRGARQMPPIFRPPPRGSANDRCMPKDDLPLRF